jgi:hypothetical protein
MPMEPEPWQTDAAGPFLTVGEVSVGALGGDRFRVESPEGSQEVEGIDRARELAHELPRSRRCALGGAQDG